MTGVANSPPMLPMDVTVNVLPRRSSSLAWRRRDEAAEVFDEDAALRPAAADAVEVDAQLAGHVAHRRRRLDGHVRAVGPGGLRGLGGLPAFAAGRLLYG